MVVISRITIQCRLVKAICHVESRYIGIESAETSQND